MTEKEWIEYCFSFYGKGGLYDIGATRTHIKQGTKILMNMVYSGQWDFAGDSFDRERLRDIIVERYGLKWRDNPQPDK